MKLLNLIETDEADLLNENVKKKFLHEAFGILLKILYPIVPHITFYLWRELSFGSDITTASWPNYDLKALEQREFELIVQVNGKLRGKITVEQGASDSVIRTNATSAESVKKHLLNSKIKRIIIVPEKLVNIVV